MTNENSQAGCAQRASPLDELESFDFEDLSSRQPRVAHPTYDRQSKNQTIETRAQESHEGDRQQNSGEGQQ